MHTHGTQVSKFMHPAAKMCTQGAGCTLNFEHCSVDVDYFTQLRFCTHTVIDWGSYSYDPKSSQLIINSLCSLLILFLAHIISTNYPARKYVMYENVCLNLLFFNILTHNLENIPSEPTLNTKKVEPAWAETIRIYKRHDCIHVKAHRYYQSKQPKYNNTS